MANFSMAWIWIGIFIQGTWTIEIQGFPSGSEKCNSTILRFSPNPVGSRSLDIFKYLRRSRHLLDCHIISVKIAEDLTRKTTGFIKTLDRAFAKKFYTKIQAIQKRLHPKHRSNDKKEVLVELECIYRGRKCVVSLQSADGTFLKEIIQSSRSNPGRKLLSLKSNSGDESFLPETTIMLAIAAIVILTVALAMCACGGNKKESEINNEVGSVVAVSSIEIKENINPQLLTEVNSSPNISRTTSDPTSHDAGTNLSSTSENGKLVPASTTIISEASQQEGPRQHLPSTGSTSSGQHPPGVSESPGSEANVEEGGSSSKPAKSISSKLKQVKRKSSTKEKSSQEKISKKRNSPSQSGEFIYKGNNANISSDSGQKQAIHIISSRKRQGSEPKEPKGSPEDKENSKQHFWSRKRSTKSTSSESDKNDVVKGEKKNSRPDSQTDQGPAVSSSASRPGLPLPPTPDKVKESSSFAEEETQYEVVENRSQNKTSSIQVTDEDYATVLTTNSVKMRNNEEVNVKKTSSRPASELYECINDNQSKVKRESSGSHQYDIVETRNRPKNPNISPSNLEYAYTVVAQRDEPVKPVETSAGSGLYEVVTDDIKKQSVVTEPQALPGVEDSYATVQKSSHEEERHSEEYPAPAPPPVSSLMHVAGSSIRGRRTQSEGDDLSLERAESPTAHASPQLERPKTMFEMEHTYAKINKSLKKRHSAEVEGHAFAPASMLPEGFYDNESDTPPPVPSSLYAELPTLTDDVAIGNAIQKSQNLSPQPKGEDDPYEEVKTKAEIKSITSTCIVSEKKNEEYSTNSDDPNSVLRRLKPPNSPRNSASSPRNSAASSHEGDKRVSESFNDYEEVLTLKQRNDKTSLSSQELSGVVNSSQTGSGDNLYDVVVDKEQGANVKNDSNSNGKRLGHYV